MAGMNTKLVQYIQHVRIFMRDYAELNRLIQGEEHSDRMIAWALYDAISDINSTPPRIGYTFESFPDENSYLLVRGAVITLLESVGLLQTRNHLTFSDGGIQVGVSDKTPLIQSWLQLLKNSYEQKKKDWLIARNIEDELGSPGGVHSEYQWTNGFYGGW